MSKRVLSLFLVLTLCLTLLPTAVFAEGGEGNIISGSSIGESSEGGGVLVSSGGTAEDNGADIAEFAAGEDAASVTKSDGTDGGTFTSLPEALNEAQDGDTVKLLASHVTDWDAVDAGDESTLAIVTKQLTLDLCGKTVDYLMVGDIAYNEETQTVTAVYSGDLTVVNNSESTGTVNGQINDIDFIRGTLDIQSGQIGYEKSVSEGGGIAGQLTCNGNSGSVTISGGRVLGLTVGEGASVTVSGGSQHAGSWYNDGTLNITGGTFSSVKFYNRAGTVAISGGTFGAITNNDASTTIPPMSLLANGYAFYDQDGTLKDGSKSDYMVNVTVKEHTHNIVDGKCACGADCPHTSWENGKCTDCGADCPHKLVSETTSGAYICSNCKAAIVAMVEVNKATTFHADIAGALEAAKDNGTVKIIVAENTLALPDKNGYPVLYADGTLTLDLNGHTLSGGGLMVGGYIGSSSNTRTGNLTVIDSIGGGKIDGERTGLKVQPGAKVKFDGQATTACFKLAVYSNAGQPAEAKFSGGIICEVAALSGIAYADLLAEGYCFYDYSSSTLGDPIKLETLKNQTKVTTPLAVAACSHPEAGEDGKCLYCGLKLAVRDSNGTIYDTLQVALDAAAKDSTIEWVQPDADMTENVTLNAAGKTVTLRMNGKTLTAATGVPLTVENGTLTVEGAANITQTGAVTNSDGSGTFAPAVVLKNGKLVFEGELTAQGGAMWTGRKPAVLAEGGELEFKDKVFLNGGLTMMGSSVLAGKLKVGSTFTSGEVGSQEVDTKRIDVSGHSTYNLSSLLADGTAFEFMSSKTLFRNISVYKNVESNVCVVAHTHSYHAVASSENFWMCDCGLTCFHDNMENGKCTVCGYICPHKNVNEDTLLCSDCNAKIVAKVEIGDTTTYASDLAYALNNAADGSTITVIAKEDRISLPDGIYVETADQGITLDLNGHSLDGYSLNVGGLTVTSKVRTGKLTVIDSEGGNGAVGVTVRDGGTFIFAPHNVNTTLLQLTVYGGTVELRGGNIKAGKWELYNSIKLSELIPNDKGYAYRLYLGGNSYGFWVTLSEAQNNTASKNQALAVVQCDHGGANGFEYDHTSSKATDPANCPYCGASAVACAALNREVVGEDFQWRKFVDLQTALDANRDGGSTLYLLDDVTGNYTIDGTQSTSLDLNGHSINGTLDVKAVAEGKNYTTTLSNTKNTATASIDVVDAHSGAKLAGSKYPAVIGKLWLHDTTKWEYILQQPDRLGFKVLNEDGTHKWYAPNDKSIPAPLENVIINSLPITSKNLSFKVDGTNVKGNKVEHGTTVQLCASCNTKDADVDIYTGVPAGDGTFTYSRKKAEYKKIGTTWYYVVDLKADTIGEYSIYFTASKDGYEVTSTPKTLTVTKLDLSKAEITFPSGTESAYDPYTGATSAPPYTVTYNGKTLTKGVDYTVTDDTYSGGVGTRRLTIKATTNGDYTGQKTADWKIVPHKVKVSVGDVTKDYDGTTDLPADTISLVSADSAAIPAGRTLPLSAGSGYELTDAKYASADASTEEKTISFTIELTDRNYTFEDGTTEKEFTLNGADTDGIFAINKVAAPKASNGTLDVISGTTLTYTYDFSQLLPNLAKGEYGTVSYRSVSVTGLENGYSVEGTPRVDGATGVLTLTFSSAFSTGQLPPSSKVGTVSVYVDTTNFKSFLLELNLNPIDQIKPTPDGDITASDITYGQTLSESSITGKMKDPDTGAAVNGTFVWKNGTVKPDAGSYDAEWTFIPAEGYDGYATATGNVTINVNKADIPAKDITPPTAVANLEYNGNEQELITKGITATGTMKYKLGKDGEWSTKIPKATDAGSYEVYYRVEGGENYKDTAEVLIKDCAIAKRSVTISNKSGDEGYQTEYMYGNRIFEPEVSNFEITGSEGEPDFSSQWIGEKPQAFSALGDYTVRVIVKETANTTGVSWDIPVKIVKNTSSVGYLSGFDYRMVYNNAGTVSYDIDFIAGVDSHATMLDRESLTLKNLIISVNDANGPSYNPYDEDTCDFKIAVTEGAEKGTIRVTLTGLNRDTASERSFCMIGVQAENMHYDNISLQVRLWAQEKGQQTLGVTMDSFTYGDPASTPAYTEPEGTLETNVTYATKDGTPLAEVPTAAGDYTVTVVCETKDTTYSSGLIAYTINPKPIGDISLTLDKDSFIYNGSAQKPIVTAKMNDTDLAGTDYTVTYPTDTTNVGTKVLKVEGHGNFTGEKELPYTIETCNTTPVLTLSPTEYTYDGTEKKPVVTVTVEGRQLAEGQDYEVAYANNTNAEDGAKVRVTSKGNYGFAPAEQGFAIHKAPIQIQPQDAVKTYGQKATLRYTLSGGDFLTPAELEEIDKLVVLASDGADETAAANANGYAISAQLKQTETANLLLSIEGTAKVVVNKAPLTVKVKDVSREYGAENPELSVSYDGFIDGEDESVLGGVLVLRYNDDINETAAVGPHENATTASGLTSENYAIEFVPGNVTIAKIPVNASAGTARRSYLNVVFDKSLEGLSAGNFIVKDSEGNIVTVTNITASSDGKNYTLSGNFEVGKEYTVKVVLSGAAVDATHQLATDEFVITPIRTSSGGGGTTRYTVSFETNGGSVLSKQTVTRNTAVKEPTAPTKEGFDFAGWYTDKELKTKYDFSAKVTKSITLYAAWTEKDNSINQIILTIGEKAAQVFGQIKTNDVAPKIVNDRTMLPARFVAENLGADVSWDGEKELVTIKGKNLKTSEDMTILIYIGSDIAYVNGKEIKLDSAAFIENDRTYTPVRFISEELGASVEWIEKEEKVVITKTLPSEK